MRANPKEAARWVRSPWHLLLPRVGHSPSACWPAPQTCPKAPLLALIQAQPFSSHQSYSAHPTLALGLAQEPCPSPALLPRAMSGFCATLHTSVFWEGGEHVIPGKTTARAWGQSVTGFSQTPSVVGDFTPSWSVAMACTRCPSSHHGAETISRVCRDGSGLQGASLGTGASTQGVQMGFESSPMTLLPLFPQEPKSHLPRAQPHHSLPL